MRPPPLASAVAVTAGLLLAAPSSRADESQLDEAVAEFDLAAKALTTTAPCDTMCKALQSMIRAADRVCELARDGTPTEQKRCTDARAKVADATSRVRASCPNCDPSPPYAPSTEPPPTTGKIPTGKMPMGQPDVGGIGPSPAPPPAPAKEAATIDFASQDQSTTGSVARRRTTTVALDVVPLFAPPFVVQPRIEHAVARRFSVSAIGAFGSLPKSSTGRSPVFGVGVEARGYVFGSFAGFGIFVGADVMYRRANDLRDGEYLEARAFPPGVTASALVGAKLVLSSGLTLDARIGPTFVLDDRREGGPRAKVLPSGGLALGWTF